MVGDYELKGIIGEGGTGAVYRGRHVPSDVRVKIRREAGARDWVSANRPR
jgi:hypothetical protein